MKRTYIGNGVYAYFNGRQLELRQEGQPHFEGIKLDGAMIATLARSLMMHTGEEITAAAKPSPAQT